MATVPQEELGTVLSLGDLATVIQTKENAI